MATNNLISKSLGDLLMESGNGVPDHTSPKGSIYTDQDTGVLWQNTNGTTAWGHLTTVAYGEGGYQDNDTTITIATLDQWVDVGNTLTEGVVVGFSANTDTLVLLDGYDGQYEVRGDVTIVYVAGSDNFEVGLSVDGAQPIAGTYNSGHVTSVFTAQHIGFQTIVDLVGGETLSFDIRNTSNNDDVKVKHAQLFARKLS